MEACPCLSATCLGMQPTLDRLRRKAPVEISVSATSRWFPAAAACSGVRPGGEQAAGRGGWWRVRMESAGRRGLTRHGRSAAGREVCVKLKNRSFN